MLALVVTIDTEEEGRWSTRYPAEGNTCENISRLVRIHRIFKRHGVIPTYLVDYPVVTDPAATETLKQFAADGASEIGAHLHPWCNPPFYPGSDSSTASTYPHNLPVEMQRAKLTHLCRTIEERVGVKPTSYRAGRWGFDHTSVPILEELGILVDTSVTPLWWRSGKHAPEFARAPVVPYHLSAADACRPGASPVVEVPMSNLVVGRHGPLLEKFVRRTGPAPGMRRLLVSLGLRSLRPEQFTLKQMIGLTDAIARRGLGVFNVMFHSSVALPGATPYVADERQLEEFCGRLEALLTHILSAHHATPLPLSRVPAFLGNAVLGGQD